MATSMIAMLGFVLFSSLCSCRTKPVGSNGAHSSIDPDGVKPGHVFFVASCLGGMLGGLLGGVAKNYYHYRT